MGRIVSPAVWLLLRGTAGIDARPRPPNRIDGGYEFDGLFPHDAAYHDKPGKSWWWVDDDEFIVTSAPLPGYQVMRRYPVERWLPVWGGDILILHRTGDKPE